MRKLFAIFSLAIVVAMHGSAQNIWNGTASYDWYTNNDGSSPYEIATPEDLAGFSNIVNGTGGQTADHFTGKTVVLTADIYMNANGFSSNLGSALQFTPIGNNNATAWDNSPTKYFAGNFNGNYHYIYNVYIKKELNNPSATNSSKYYAQAGLFGAVSGTVNMQNVILKNLYLEGGNAIGSIIGYYEGNVSLTNCMSINFTFYSSATTDFKMGSPGGLVGGTGSYSSTLTVNNCGATGGDILPDWGGALIGRIRGSSTITNCYFYGTFSEGRIGALNGDIPNWSNNYAGNTNTTTSSNDWTGTTCWLGTALAQANMKNNAGFVAQLGTGWRMDVDNVNDGFPVLLNLDADCSPVTGLHATTVTGNSIDIEWTAPSPAPNTYSVIWGTSGFSPANGTSDPYYIGSSSTSSPSFSITNLDAATSYIIAIQSNCGGNMLSPWIVMAAGTIANEVYGNNIWHGYVYAQTGNAMKTFGNYLGYVEEQPQFSRLCGNGAWTGENATWGTAAPSDNFSVRYKMSKNFDCGNYVFTINADEYWRLSVDGGQTWLPSHNGTTQAGADHWTISCCAAWQTDAVPLDGLHNLVLEYTEGGSGAYLTVSWAEVPVTITSLAGPYSAEITFSNGTNWDLKVSATPLADPANDPAGILDINTNNNPYTLTNLSPTTHYYVYALPSNCGTAGWGSHDFTTPIMCAQPSNISASNIGTTFADITWNGPLNAGLFNIEWGPQGSFTPGSDNPPNIDAVATNNYTITTGLIAATNYTVAIQSACDGVYGDSEWATYNFTTERCEPSEQCTYTLTLNLSPGADPSFWNGTRIDIKQDNILVYTTGVMTSVNDGTVFSFTLCKSVITEITVPQMGNQYGKFVAWQLKTPSGVVVASSLMFDIIGTPIFAVGNDCEPCQAPVVTSSAITEDSFNVGFSTGTSWNIKVSTFPLANPADDIADIANVTETINNPYSVQDLNAATTYYIYVQNSCGSNWVLKEVTTLTSCLSVTNLAASQITHNSAHFAWNAPADGSATSYIIEYGPAATFSPGTATYENTYTTTNNYYDLSSLNAGTAYKFSVRSNCGSGSVSAWETVPFGTAAIETFGEGIWHGYVYQSSNPDAWQNRFETYLGYVEENAQFTKATTLDPWTGGNVNTTWINSNAAPSDYFAVRYKMSYNFPCGNYTLTLPNVDEAVRLSIDSGATWLTNLCAGANCGSAGNWEINGNYHNGTYTVTNIYLSGTTHLVLEYFEATGNASVGFQFEEQPITITPSEFTSGSMDLAFSSGTEWNIKVSTEELDNPATDPADFTFNNITANPYSLTGLDPETTYHIYVQLACGSAWSSTTTSTVAACPTPLGLTAIIGDTYSNLSWAALGMNGWNLKVSVSALTDPDNQPGLVFDNWVDTNYKQVTGLTNNTIYYWYVQSDCGSGWANGHFTTKTPGTDCAVPIVINQTDIPYTGSGTTVDMGNEYSNTAMGTFDDYNDVLYRITLTEPMTLDFKVNAVLSATMGLFNGCPDVGTLISDPVYISYLGTTHTQSLLPGVYYLMLDKFGTNYGTTYNYTLTISCATPTLTVNTITANSANINISSYTSNLYIKVSTIPINPETTDGNIIDNELITGTGYSLTELSPSTDYYIYVNTGCSPWASATFTTYGTCPQPTNLVVANTNHNSTELSFTGTAAAMQYDIEWGLPGFIPGTSDAINSTTITNLTTELPYLITGLSEITDYTVAVRSECGAMDASGWKIVNFKTKAEESYGNGIWHGYVYDAPSGKVFGDYLGYVEEQAQFSRNYTTQNAAWNGENPVWLSSAPVDNFLARYLMTYNFQGNSYVFHIEANEYFRFSIDGGATWLPFTRNNEEWTLPDNDYWTTLSGSPTWHSDTLDINGILNLVLEFNEVYSGAYLNFSFVNTECQAPAAISATGITLSEAEISWTGNDNAANYTMEVCAAGVSLGDGTVYPNVTSPVSISNLTANTAYTVHIKSNCGSSESSYANHTFHTLCDNVPDSQIGFTEATGWTGTAVLPTAAAGSFNGLQGGGNDCNGTAPNCWTINAGCMYGTSGNSYPRIELSNNTRYVIMPPLASDITMTDLKMKIWMRSDNVAQELKIFTTTGNDLTGIEPLTTIAGGQGSAFPTNEPYVMHEVDLGALYGTTGATGNRIGFTPAGGYRVDIYKVVIWKELPPTCPAPGAITFTNVTNNSATVSWTAGGTETEWAVHYRQQGIPSWTVVSPNPTTTSCILSGLSGTTTYEVQVKAICTPGTDESAWTTSVNFTTLCASTAIPHTESFTNSTPAFPTCWSAYRDDLFSTTGVTTEAFMANSSSGCVGRSLRLYANYANAILISPSLTVDANQLEVTYCSRREQNGAPVGTVSVGYLTDLNDPTSFVPIETYSTNTDYPVAYTGYTFSVNLSSVPAGINHVAFKHTTNGILGQAGWIWLDEIMLNYATPTTCDAPTALTVTPAETGATVSWTASATAVSYTVEYKPTASSTWSSSIPVMAPAVSTVLNGLLCGTSYDVRVKSDCGSDGTSAYVSTTFTTLDCPACSAPTAVNHSAVTPTSAAVTWTPGGNETQWAVAWKATSASAWNRITTSSNPYTLSSLIPETCYEVRVKALCSPSDSSVWSATDNFCTPQTVCNAPTNLTASTITENSITIAWQPNGETDWKVSWRNASTGNSGSGDAHGNAYTGYDITGLLDSTEYQICVKAVCASGLESDSSCANITTLKRVAIHDITLAAAVKLYPNPANDKLTIEMTSNFNTVEIINTLGQVVYRADITGNQTVIDVSGYSTGMYYVKLQGDNSMATKKFVKRRLIN